MKKQLTSVKNFVKSNKIPLISAVAAVVVVGLPVYAHQDQQTELKKKEAARVEQVKAESDSKPEAQPEQTAPEPEPTPAPAPAPAPKPVAVAPKTEVKKETAPVEKTKPAAEQVPVTLARSGASVVASIGTSKPGTCYFTFKNYTDPNNPQYLSVESSASGGSCSAPIPAGTWTHAMVTYKAADYSAKGYSSKIAL